MDKVIITAAITGANTFPSQTPYLPLTPKEISDSAVEAANNGAAVVHIHARDPLTAAPSSDLGVFRDIISSIKNRSDAVICLTTGGGISMTVEERTKIISVFKPEMASFNLGSMNFGVFPLAKKIEEFKYEFEKKYIESTKGLVFKNTFEDLEYICNLVRENKTKPELEIYDVGQLYNAHFLLQEGLLDLPIHMQFVMGVLGGIQSTPEDLFHLKNTADKLFGDKYTWSIIGVGRMEFQLGAMAIILGGHVRVGFEDNIYISKGTLAKSNAELVTKMIEIVRNLEKDPASPEEARKILGLKGLGEVNF